MDEHITRRIQKDATRILVIDGNPKTCEALSKLAQSIEELKLQFEPCADIETALKTISLKKHELYFIGASVSGRNAVDIVQECLGKHRRAGIVVVLSELNEQIANDALRIGAYDVVLLPRLTNESLQDCVEIALQRYSRLRKDSAEFDKGYTTDLSNLRARYEFRDKAESVIRDVRRKNEPLSFLFLDIDNFSHITAKLGDASARNARETVAAAVNSLARPNDIVGRYGGEEFCLVMPGMTADQAYQVAEKLRAEVAKSDYVTVSIGIAELTDDMRDLSDLIIHADRAMYRAKQRGRNRIITAKISKSAFPASQRHTTNTIH